MTRLKWRLLALLHFIFGGFSWHRSRIMDNLLDEIMRANPPIERLSECVVYFKGYPPLWICNFPYASFKIYDHDTHPSIYKCYEFKEFLDRKIIEYYKTKTREEN